MTGGLLNGSQRDSRLNPTYLKPGEVYEIEFDLHFTTWVFKPGHRIRVAVSNALFPMIWPTPYPMTTQLFLGSKATSLDLPMIPSEPRPVPDFFAPEPREERADAHPLEDPGWPYKHQVIRDLSLSTTTVELEAEKRWEIQGRIYTATEKIAYKTCDDDPAHSSFKGEGEHILQLGDRQLELRLFVTILSDVKNFHMIFVRKVFESNRLIRERRWEAQIPREFQ